MAVSPRPGVLMLGRVHHAKAEFGKLSEVADVTVRSEAPQRPTPPEADPCSNSPRAPGMTLFATAMRASTAMSSPSRGPQITGRFDAELISHLPPSVRFISHNGAGYDQIDIEPCNRRNISVSNTPTAVDAATANTALFLILGALRRAWIPQEAIRAGKWRKGTTLGRDPDDLTLGILGMGGIGTATAKRAAAFGFKLQYHNRTPVANLDEQFRGQSVPRYVSFDQLLRTSDVISVHLPLGPATQGLIGAEQLNMMKDGVIIVNTARGAIIDEAALVGSLESGKVWSVGLDVFEKEPAVHPGLLKHPGAVLLPHVGTATVDTQRRMEALVIDNVRSAITKGRLVTQVDEQKPTVAKL
ncbi:hypothetical protein Purlil1_1437 [Purpureocillium lilacinum]|uniref:Hydroxyisocaproate dehydrogenase n=1 Tax=Purpureocillium lilacinum TaxID=33203 RepID=A0ABR0CDG1_PURLI|nr:hypothetical protein Purlil1_1437 [Purpureocillium lilacinum]